MQTVYFDSSGAIQTINYLDYSLKIKQTERVFAHFQI